MGSKTRKKKTGGTARSGRVKRRASKSRSRTKHSSQAKSEEGPMDSFVFRRGKTHDPIARLSLLGAGLEPVADDDAPVTENSRRFDQPISRRRGEATSASGTTAAAREEKKSDIDSCDLLGSIIPEQMKTLAPGRLFAVRGGRFNTTEDFEKYKAKKTGQLSSELKERLGIPIDPVQEEAKKTGKAKENVKANVSAKKPLLESCGLGPSNSFKKPGAAAPDSIIRPREEVLESSGDRNSTSSVRKLERPQDSERCDRAEQRKRRSAWQYDAHQFLPSLAPFILRDSRDKSAAPGILNSDKSGWGDATDNELLHTIEGIAKEGIKPFVKKISRDQYKGVMRAVVRECYKRRILEKNVIEEKVKKYVRAARKGEPLPAGHHSSKRNHAMEEAGGPAGEMKRPKVEV
ncbi:unnamed protein product [Heligmosomoides polygyrus]|uniref:Uncharacterized protein n=1 Tax=Heligmosomoides polygyrus TaxID=6339 RepID=A0A183G8C2_HELPZ|nr:unnamed protein product [Heligmosomoides polygyrus]